MAAQPKRTASVDRQRNARLLCGVIAESEHLLRRQARRHAELPEDAEDALQSAFVLFIERYRDDCDPLAWLYTTVKREAWALRRKASRRRESSLEAGGDADDAQPWADSLPNDTPTPEERIARDEELATRRALIAVLKPDERTALLLLGLGYSYEEIGRGRAWSYTKVNRCVAEGRAELRRRLRDS